MWVDNHANQRYLWMPHVFQSPRTFFLLPRGYLELSCVRQHTYVCTFHSVTRSVYACVEVQCVCMCVCVCSRVYSKELDPTSEAEPRCRSSQLPCRSKLSISIGYNDALVTIGYCGEPQPWVILLADQKGKKKIGFSTQRARTCHRDDRQQSRLSATPIDATS